MQQNLLIPQNNLPLPPPPPQHFLLKWNNHRPNLISLLSSLYTTSTLTDCTLLTPDSPGPLPAHRIILSACSPYFHNLFTSPSITPDKNPVIIFNDVKYGQLKTLLEFMYRGEISIDERELGDVLRVAEGLCVKGLSNSGGANGNSSSFGNGANGGGGGADSNSSSSHSHTEERDHEQDEEANGEEVDDEEDNDNEENEHKIEPDSEPEMELETHTPHHHNHSTSQHEVIEDHHSHATFYAQSPMPSTTTTNQIVIPANLNQTQPSSPLVKRKRGRQPKITKTAIMDRSSTVSGNAIPQPHHTPMSKPSKSTNNNPAQTTTPNKKSATIKPRIIQKVHHTSAANSNNHTNSNVTGLGEPSSTTPPTSISMMTASSINRPQIGIKKSTDPAAASPAPKRRKYNTTNHATKGVKIGATVAKKGSNKGQSSDPSGTTPTGQPTTSTNPLTEMSVRGLNLFRYASIIDNLYHCTECWKLNIKKSFKNKYSFQRHAFLYHEGNSRKVFPCTICGREFSRPDKMKNHLKGVHFRKGDGDGGVGGADELIEEKIDVGEDGGGDSLMIGDDQDSSSVGIGEFGDDVGKVSGISLLD